MLSRAVVLQSFPSVWLPLLMPYFCPKAHAFWWQGKLCLHTEQPSSLLGVPAQLVRVSCAAATVLGSWDQDTGRAAQSGTDLQATHSCPQSQGIAYTFYRLQNSNLTSLPINLIRTGFKTIDRAFICNIPSISKSRCIPMWADWIYIRCFQHISGLAGCCCGNKR